ncbi:hypothetical protein [Thalassotalea agarivorans]|uniref:hypothetical protein n=1 Tax=Thalassotalea agarivorans TaxID=349064 RepID=UPI00115FCEE7|nr:hypothetical protein [Thalassotalea agarivorans]
MNRSTPELFVHIGPGKTGTSVIQNWCKNNRKLLKKHGIYYPNHNLDANGVSSGHVNLLFNNQDGKLDPDLQKFELFRNRLQRLNYDKVLISSEVFWMHIGVFNKFFDKIKFIYYVRSPIDFFESSYNQVVKRNYVTAPLVDRLDTYSPNPYGTQKVLPAFRTLGAEKFIIRLYDRKILKDGNILNDFLEIFKVKTITHLDNTFEVNNSYTYQALEYKRWINKFCLNRNLDSQLDVILQSYKAGERMYTLLPEDVFLELKERAINRVKHILPEYGVPQDLQTQFLENIYNYQRTNYKKQSFDSEIKLEIEQFIRSVDTTLMANIEQAIRQINSSES